MTIKETFKLSEEKDGKYRIDYTMQETDVHPFKILQTYNQLESKKAEQLITLQEFEPHVTKTRISLIKMDIDLLKQRLTEVKKSENIDKEILSKLIENIKKNIKQREFDIEILGEESLEKRKTQINKIIENYEMRLREIRPYLSDIKLKVRKEEEKAKRLNKEMMEKLKKKREEEVR